MQKNVLTQKSGQFVFSHLTSPEKLEKYLIEIRVLYQTLIDLPVLPELAARIDKKIITKTIFGNAAVDGNPLTEDQVAKILSTPEEKMEKPKQAEREVINLKAVYDYIGELETPKSPFELTEKIILLIHSIVTREVSHEYNVPGQYRKNTIVLRVEDENQNEIYTPPKTSNDIKVLMQEFIEWINSKPLLELGSITRAALAHYYLRLIHPFSDGNGRTARSVETLMMRMAGIRYVPIMLADYYYRNVDDYLEAFYRARRNPQYDLTSFLELILKGITASLKEMEVSITLYIRRATLRDYYDYLKKKKEVTQRQHDLLIMITNNATLFSIEDLFNTSPFDLLYRKLSERTASRDLKKLCDKNLLLRKDNVYQLNFRVLG